MSSNSKQRLADIRDAAERLQKYTAVTVDEFLNDQMRQDAVVRVLEIISEASRGVDDAIKSKYPDVDWQALADAGNIYRHRYHAVDLRLVWSDVSSAEFQALVRVCLEELPFTEE